MSETQTCPACNQGKMTEQIVEEGGVKKKKVVCKHCGRTFDVIVDNVEDRPKVKESSVIS